MAFSVPDVFQQESSLTDRLKWYALNCSSDGVELDDLHEEIISALYQEDALVSIPLIFKNSLTQEEWVHFYDTVGAFKVDPKTGDAFGTRFNKFIDITRWVKLSGPPRYNIKSILHKDYETEEEFRLQVVTEFQNITLIAAELMYTPITQLADPNRLPPGVQENLASNAAEGARDWMIVFASYLQNKELPADLFSYTVETDHASATSRKSFSIQEWRKLNSQ